MSALSAHERLVVREALASALYLALVLLGTLIAVPDDRLPSDSRIVQLIFGAGLGLVAAHWLAFRLAARMTTEDGGWSPSAAQEATAQLVGGLATAVLAAVPFLLLDGFAARTVALLLLAALPAAAGAAVARLRGRSWSFAAFGAAVALLGGVGVAVLKILLPH